MPDIDLYPMYLSLKVALLATAIALALGVAIALLLARREFPGKSLLETIIILPLVLPPTVIGYYLLLTIGRTGPLGRLLQGTFDLNLVFTWQAAVLASCLASIPLMIKSAQAAFAGVDRTLEDAARTLGRNEWQVFLGVTLPLAWRGVVAGTVLSFSRAIGEFGITLMVAGSIPGRTQTMPLAIYDAVQANDLATANLMSLTMTLAVLLIVFFLGQAVRVKF